MSASQHTVTIRGNSDDFKANIDSDIAALKAMGETINVTNRQAVNAWREEVQAQREVMQQLGATAQQLNALNAAVAGTEASINRAAESQGRAFTQMGRGMFMMAGQQNDLLASSRGIITAISASATMIAGPWAAAIAVAGIALLRFFDKADEGFETFKKNAEEMKAAMAHMMPADLDRQVSSFVASMRLLEQEQERRHLAQLVSDPLLHPLGALQNLFRLRDIDKEIKGLQDLTTAAEKEGHTKRLGLLDEAERTTLTRQQQAVLRDLAALEEARDKGLIGRSQAVEARLAAEQAALRRTKADILRLFPDAGETAEMAVKFGEMFSAFDEQLAQHLQTGADKNATAMEETWMKGLDKGLEATSKALDAKLGPSSPILKRFIDRIFGPGPGINLSGRMGPGMVDPVLVAAQEGIREGLEWRKKQTPDSGRAIIAPEEVRKHEFDPTKGFGFAAQQIGGALGKGFTDVKTNFIGGLTEMEQHLKEFETVGKLAASTFEAAFDSAMNQIVAGHRVSVKELKKLAVEPIVTELEGLAKLAAIRAAIDIGKGDFPGAALMLAASAAAIVAAAEVASLGGSGGSGSAGPAVGGGTTGSSVHGAALGQQGIGALAGQRAGQAAMTLEVILTQKSPDGRTLQRQRQLLQRLDDRQVPVRMNI